MTGAEGTDDNDSMSRQVGRGPVGKGVTTTVAAALAAASGPLAPAVMGAFTAMEAFGDKLNATVARRDAVVVEAAAERAGLDVEEALKKIMKNERLLIVAGLAIDAARRTTMRDKARLLGRSLGAILIDKTQIDEESMWISIISRLEPPHLRLLNQFLLAPSDPDNHYGEWRKSGDRRIGDAGYKSKLGALVRPLSQDLVQLGLLECLPVSLQPFGSVDHSITWTDTDTWAHATPLAPELMKRLDEIGITLC
jgi:hypothetical protein